MQIWRVVWLLGRSVVIIRIVVIRPVCKVRRGWVELGDAALGALHVHEARQRVAQLEPLVAPGVVVALVVHDALVPRGVHARQLERLAVHLLALLRSPVRQVSLLAVALVLVTEVYTVRQECLVFDRQLLVLRVVQVSAHVLEIGVSALDGIRVFIRNVALLVRGATVGVCSVG